MNTFKAWDLKNKCCEIIETTSIIELILKL